MRKNSPGHKLFSSGISIILCLSLGFDPSVTCLQDFATAEVTSSASSPSTAGSLMSSESDIDEILSKDMRKGKVFQGKGEIQLVLIRDLHCQEEAQIRISRVIEELSKKAGLRRVFLEGADGPVKTLLFESFPDADVRKRVGREFLKSGYLSGAEYAAIVMGWGNDLELYGVEDSGTYLENLKAFRHTREIYRELAGDLNRIEDWIRLLNEKQFSRELKDLVDVWEMLKGESPDFRKALDVIENVTQKNLELHPSKVDPLRKWEGIEDFKEFIEMTSRVKEEILNEEVKQLVGLLEKNLVQEELKVMLAKSLEYRLGRLKPSAYFAILSDWYEEYRLDSLSFDSKYPQVFLWMSALVKQESLEIQGVWEEMQEWVSDLRQEYADREGVKDLLYLNERWRLLKKLSRLELSRQELKALKVEIERGSLDQFSDLCRVYPQGCQETPTQGLVQPRIAELVKSAKRFYEIAEVRDEILVEKTLKKLGVRSEELGDHNDSYNRVTSHPASTRPTRLDLSSTASRTRRVDESGEAGGSRVAVLIAGGFHTEGLHSLLEEKGISYSTWTPSIVKDLKESPYEEIMMKEAYDLDQIEFSQKRLAWRAEGGEVKQMLSAAVLLNGILGEMGSGRGLDPIRIQFLQDLLKRMREVGSMREINQILNVWLDQETNIEILGRLSMEDLRLLFQALDSENVFLRLTDLDSDDQTQAQLALSLVSEVYGERFPALVRLTSKYFELAETPEQQGASAAVHMTGLELKRGRAGLWVKRPWLDESRDTDLGRDSSYQTYLSQFAQMKSTHIKQVHLNKLEGGPILEVGIDLEGLPTEEQREVEQILVELIDSMDPGEQSQLLIQAQNRESLARISHQISTATANSASSASSDLVGPTQRTVKYASYGLGRLPRIQSGLDVLATKSDEKPGLGRSRLLMVSLLENSFHLFEDHAANGLIGINQQLFSPTLKRSLRIKLLKLGLRHELRHECGVGNSVEEETLLMEEDASFSKRLKLDLDEFINLRPFISDDSPWLAKVAEDVVPELMKAIQGKSSALDSSKVAFAEFVLRHVELKQGERISLLKNLKQVVLNRKDLVQNSLVEALALVLDRENLPTEVYVSILDLLGLVIEKKVKVVQSSTLETLVRFLKRPGLDPKLYEHAGIAIEQILDRRVDLVSREIVVSLEDILDRELKAEQLNPQICGAVTGSLTPIARHSSPLLKRGTFDLLQDLLSRPGLSRALTALVIKALAGIAESSQKKLFINTRSSTLKAVEDFMEREKLGSEDYRSAAQVIRRIGELRSEHISGRTFQVLEHAFTHEWLDTQAYEAILNAMMTMVQYQPKAVRISTAGVLEDQFEKTQGGHQILIKQIFKDITHERPELIQGNKFAENLLTVPLQTLTHGLPQHRVYFHEHLLNQTRHFAEAIKYSISLSAYRLLKRYGLPQTDANIIKAVDFVMRKRRRISEKRIFSRYIEVINIAHVEDRFDIDKIEGFEKKTGVRWIRSFKGPSSKGDVLESIRRGRGRSTIFFNGHGGKNHIWLEQGKIGQEDSNYLRNTSAISFVEMGDALMERERQGGELNDVAILISACYSYNFCVKLLNYLAARGVRKLPIVVSSSNFDRLSRGDHFLDSLIAVKEDVEGVGFTMGDLFFAEDVAFLNNQDSATFIPAYKDEIDSFTGVDAPQSAAAKAPLETPTAKEDVAPEKLTGRMMEVASIFTPYYRERRRERGIAKIFAWLGEPKWIAPIWEEFLFRMIPLGLTGTTIQSILILDPLGIWMAAGIGVGLFSAAHVIVKWLLDRAKPKEERTYQSFRSVLTDFARYLFPALLLTLTYLISFSLFSSMPMVAPFIAYGVNVVIHSAYNRLFNVEVKEISQPEFATADLSDQHDANLQYMQDRASFLHFGRKKSFWGPIVTVKAFENQDLDNSFVRKAIDESEPGSVIVVDGNGMTHRALLGGDLAQKAAKKNLNFIIHGAVRDVDEINDLDIGVLALGTSPRKTEKKNRGTFKEDIPFKGVAWKTGHYAYVDNDGVVISQDSIVQKPEKGVLFSSYWLASKLMVPLDWVLMRFGKLPTTQDFKEDRIVPIIEEGALVLLSFGDIWAYGALRALFVARHAFQDRAATVDLAPTEQVEGLDSAQPRPAPAGRGPRRAVSQKRTLFEKIAYPLLMSGFSIEIFYVLTLLPALMPFAIPIMFFVGLFVHVSLNREVTLEKLRFQKGVLGDEFIPKDFAAIDFNGVEDILSAPDFKPEHLINVLKKDDFLKAQYEFGPVVWEGYSLEEHTLMVMKQFEHYFSHHLPEGVDKQFYRVLLALHDIGKPMAIQKGDRDTQHDYSQKIMKPLLEKLGFEQSQIDFAVALIESDPIGQYLRGAHIDIAISDMQSKAQKVGMRPDRFLEFILVYFQSDASSYTDDAGGKPSPLNHAFEFDRGGRAMRFSPLYEGYIKELRERISNPVPVINKLDVDRLNLESARAWALKIGLTEDDLNPLENIQQIRTRVMRHFAIQDALQAGIPSHKFEGKEFQEIYEIIFQKKVRKESSKLMLALRQEYIPEWRAGLSEEDWANSAGSSLLFPNDYDDSYPLRTELMEEVVGVAQKLAELESGADVVILGRSPQWFGQAAQLMDTRPERFKSVFFSRPSYDEENDRPVDLHTLTKSERDAYRSYLQELGLDPQSIVGKSKKTFIVEYRESGENLKFFLAVLEEWAEELGLRTELQEKLSLFLLENSEVRASVRDRSFDLGPYEIKIQNLSNQLVRDLIKGTVFQDAIGLYFPFWKWDQIDPLTREPSRKEKILLSWLRLSIADLLGLDPRSLLREGREILDSASNKDGFVQSKHGKAPEELKLIRESAREKLSPLELPNFADIEIYLARKIGELESRVSSMTGWEREQNEKHIIKSNEALERLKRLHNEKKIYQFPLIVYNKEDYALAFGNDSEIGMASKLTYLPMTLLAELLFHEALCFDAGHDMARRVQEALLDENYPKREGAQIGTSILRTEIRGFIDERARRQRIVVDPVTKVELAKIEYDLNRLKSQLGGRRIKKSEAFDVIMNMAEKGRSVEQILEVLRKKKLGVDLDRAKEALEESIITDIAHMGAEVRTDLPIPADLVASHQSPVAGQNMYDLLNGKSLTFTMTDGNISFTESPELAVLEEAMEITKDVTGYPSPVSRREEFYDDLTNLIKNRERLKGRTDLNGTFTLSFGDVETSDERRATSDQKEAYRTLFGNHKRDHIFYCNIRGFLNIKDKSHRRALFLTGISHEAVHEFLPSYAEAPEDRKKERSKEEQEGRLLKDLEDKLSQEDSKILMSLVNDPSLFWIGLNAVASGDLVEGLRNLIREIGIPAVQLGERQQVADGVEKIDVVFDSSEGYAKGRAVMIDPSLVRFEQRVIPEAVAFDFGQYSSASRDPKVASGEREFRRFPGVPFGKFMETPGIRDALLISNSLISGFWTRNDFLIVDGNLVTKPEGTRGLFEESYSPVSGKFWVFSFDSGDPGVREVNLVNGKMDDAGHQIQEGVAGLPLVLDGKNVTEMLEFAKPPVQGHQHIYENIQTIRAAMSAVGKTRDGKIVMLHMAGDSAHKGETTFNELAEALLRLDVVEAVALGSSHDVNQYVMGDENGPHVQGKARVGSMSGPDYPEGRPLSAFILAYPIEQESSEDQLARRAEQAYQNARQILMDEKLTAAARHLDEVYQNQNYADDLFFLIEEFIRTPGIDRILRKLALGKKGNMSGIAGELYHASILKKRGYEIISLGFEFRQGGMVILETDLVVKKEGEYSIVEVKHVAGRRWHGRARDAYSSVEKWLDRNVLNVKVGHSRKLKRYQQVIKSIQTSDREEIVEALKEQIGAEHVERMVDQIRSGKSPLRIIFSFSRTAGFSLNSNGTQIVKSGSDMREIDPSWLSGENLPDGGRELTNLARYLKSFVTRYAQEHYLKITAEIETVPYKLFFKASSVSPLYGVEAGRAIEGVSPPLKNVAAPGVSEKDIHEALDANFKKGTLLAVSDTDLDQLALLGFKVSAETFINFVADNIQNIEGDEHDYKKSARDYLTGIMIRAPDAKRNLSGLLRYIKTLHQTRGKWTEPHRYVIPLGKQEIFDRVLMLGHAGLQQKTQDLLGKEGKRIAVPVKTVFLSEKALIAGRSYKKGLRALIRHEKEDLAQGSHRWRGNEQKIIYRFWEMAKRIHLDSESWKTVKSYVLDKQTGLNVALSASLIYFSQVFGMPFQFLVGEPSFLELFVGKLGDFLSSSMGIALGAIVFIRGIRAYFDKYFMSQGKLEFKTVLKALIAFGLIYLSEHLPIPYKSLVPDHYQYFTERATEFFFQSVGAVLLIPLLWGRLTDAVRNILKATWHSIKILGLAVLIAMNFFFATLHLSYPHLLSLKGPVIHGDGYSDHLDQFMEKVEIIRSGFNILPPHHQASILRDVNHMIVFRKGIPPSGYYNNVWGEMGLDGKVFGIPTVVHESGHVVFTELLTERERGEFKALTDQSGSDLKNFVSGYAMENRKVLFLYISEDFAETYEEWARNSAGLLKMAEENESEILGQKVLFVARRFIFERDGKTYLRVYRNFEPQDIEIAQGSLLEGIEDLRSILGSRSSQVPSQEEPSIPQLPSEGDTGEPDQMDTGVEPMDTSLVEGEPALEEMIFAKVWPDGATFTVEYDLTKELRYKEDHNIGFLVTLKGVPAQVEFDLEIEGPSPDVLRFVVETKKGGFYGYEIKNPKKSHVSLTADLFKLWAAKLPKTKADLPQALDLKEAKKVFIEVERKSGTAPLRGKIHIKNFGWGVKGVQWFEREGQIRLAMVPLGIEVFPISSFKNMAKGNFSLSREGLVEGRGGISNREVGHQLREYLAQKSVSMDLTRMSEFMKTEVYRSLDQATREAFESTRLVVLPDRVSIAENERGVSYAHYGEGRGPTLFIGGRLLDHFIDQDPESLATLIRLEMNRKLYRKENGQDTRSSREVVQQSGVDSPSLDRLLKTIARIQAKQILDQWGEDRVEEVIVKASEAISAFRDEEILVDGVPIGNLRGAVLNAVIEELIARKKMSEDKKRAVEESAEKIKSSRIQNDLVNMLKVLAQHVRKVNETDQVEVLGINLLLEEVKLFLSSGKTLTISMSSREIKFLDHLVGKNAKNLEWVMLDLKRNIQNADLEYFLARSMNAMVQGDPLSVEQSMVLEAGIVAERLNTKEEDILYISEGKRAIYKMRSRAQSLWESIQYFENIAKKNHPIAIDSRLLLSLPQPERLIFLKKYGPKLAVINAESIEGISLEHQKMLGDNWEKFKKLDTDYQVALVLFEEGQPLISVEKAANIPLKASQTGNIEYAAILAGYIADQGKRAARADPRANDMLRQMLKELFDEGRITEDELEGVSFSKILEDPKNFLFPPIKSQSTIDMESYLRAQKVIASMA